MSGWLRDIYYGRSMGLFWALFRRRARAKSRLAFHALTFLLNRMARRRGGYIGPTADIPGPLSLPHGLGGVYISRYASIGPGCRIYQNVTVGEVDGRAPRIGADCLLGAGAVVLGPITVGQGAKIGAGAVVNRDVPPGATVVAQQPRTIIRGDSHGSEI